MRLLARVRGLWQAFTRPRVAALNLEHEHSRLTAALDVLERKLTSVERDRDAWQQRCDDAQQQLRIAQADIEVNKVTIDGLVAFNKTMETYCETITRVLSTKGQPVNVNDNLSALTLTE